MSMFSDFLHPEEPYEDAQKKMEQYYQMIAMVMAPYLQQGQGAYGDVRSAIDSLMNPMELEGEWLEGYETSPYAISEAQTSTEQGLDMLSATGMLGSTPGLRGLQANSTEIINKDRDKYLDRMMQKYLAGSKIAQDLYGTGANSANNFSGMLKGMGDSMGEVEYGKGAAPGNLFGNLLGTGTSLLAAGMGGGKPKRNTGPTTYHPSGVGGGY